MTTALVVDLDGPGRHEGIFVPVTALEVEDVRVNPKSGHIEEADRLEW